MLEKTERVIKTQNEDKHNYTTTHHTLTSINVLRSFDHNSLHIKTTITKKNNAFVKNKR